MIIYGFRSRNKLLGQVQYNCRSCGREAYHGIVRSTRHFTGTGAGSPVVEVGEDCAAADGQVELSSVYQARYTDEHMGDWLYGQPHHRQAQIAHDA
jgi:hypothetical protein